MNIQKKLRVLLITGLNNGFIAELIAKFKEMPEIEFEDVIYCNPHQNLFRNVKRNIRKHGPVYIPWRLSRLVNTMIISKLWTLIEKIFFYPEVGEDLFSVCSKLRINIHEVNDIHSDQSAKVLEALPCDLFLLCGTPILKKAVFAMPSIGTLNLHQGDVTKYRGAPPGFWELWNNEKEVGVTVHFVDEGIDTGDIVLQKNVPVFRYDNLNSVERKLQEISLSLYPEAVRQIATGKCQRIKQQKGRGKQYSFPTIKQIFQLKLRIAKNQFIFKAFSKLILKKLIFPICLLIVWLRDACFMCRGRSILSVLYYHRVTDVCQDGMTVSTCQFEKQIRFLKKHYRILSGSELIDWLSHGKFQSNDKPEKAVLITFDDGYEDNYVNALPILKKYHCPAIFFISTNFIENGLQFPHDRELQPRLTFAKMNWQQLENAMRSNIEIGVHSDTHCNLGDVSDDCGIQEVEISIKKYREHFGKPPVFMSYPFGGKRDISPKVANYIKDRSCIRILFSAYDNKNISPFDYYNIRRINIGTGDKCLFNFWFKVEGGIRNLLFPFE